MPHTKAKAAAAAAGHKLRSPHAQRYSSAGSSRGKFSHSSPSKRGSKSFNDGGAKPKSTGHSGNIRRRSMSGHEKRVLREEDEDEIKELEKRIQDDAPPKGVRHCTQPI